MDNTRLDSPSLLDSPRLLDFPRLLECLAAEHGLLRRAAAGRLTAAVPSCPGWTVADLVDHVAMIYLHKVECMRLGHRPADWPPPDTGQDPLTTLDQEFRRLSDEFASRRPGDAAFTFYPPDQTVGFWIRRMALETAVHRVDAELAVGAADAVTPIDADLADDGIDEVLRIFLGWATGTTGDLPEAAPMLAEADGRAVAVRTPGVRFLVRPAADGVRVDAAAGDDADASVTGEPSDVLRWLWHRADDEAVQIGGDPALIGYLRRLLVLSTQ